jgi:hypothetical protein
MRKRGSIVCKLCQCLPQGSINSARMRIIVTAALQWQFLQTELILWMCFVQSQSVYYNRTFLINEYIFMNIIIN